MSTVKILCTFLGSGKNPFQSMKSGNTSVAVVLHISSNESRVRMETDERYQLTVNTDDSGTQVHITAHTYFGARHGLETLSQLISYDELTDSLQMHAKAIVKDKPQYVHRGLLIDTSRNFFSIDILKGIQKFNFWNHASPNFGQ